MTATPMVDGWRLFAWLAAAISLVMAWPVLRVDPHDGQDVLKLIRHSVRVSLPFFLLAYVASAWQRLRPNRWSRWLLHNRRMFGLLFSFGMTWQALYITMLYNADRALFHELVLTPQFLIVDGIGYCFIIAMTLTSFDPIRRHLTPRAWRLLHTSGMTYLWFVLAGTYVYATVLGSLWFAPVAAMFVAAFALRLAACRSN
ncbi:MAG: hypothetical protein AB7N70_03680 [Dehalococcoidia bacterium]